jgi:hypothetical protein
MAMLRVTRTITRFVGFLLRVRHSLPLATS